MPDHAAPNNRGQIHRVGETVTRLLIGEKIHRQGQTTAGQDGHDTLLAESADQAIEDHRRDVTHQRTQF
jgi:hypothetical protein